MATKNSSSNSTMGQASAQANAHMLEEENRSGVLVDIDCLPFFNYALAHKLPTPVRKLTIDNNTLFDVRDLSIVVDSKTDLLIDTQINIDCIPAGESVEIDGRLIRVDVERILQLTEMMTDELSFKYVIDGEVMLENTRTIDFFAFDEWLGLLLPESIAAFVTPNHPALAQIIWDLPDNECRRGDGTCPHRHSFASGSNLRIPRLRGLDGHLAARNGFILIVNLEAVLLPFAEQLSEDSRHSL